jgi:hypothetical protein
MVLLEMCLCWGADGVGGVAGRKEGEEGRKTMIFEEDLKGQTRHT